MKATRQQPRPTTANKQQSCKAKTSDPLRKLTEAAINVRSLRQKMKVTVTRSYPFRQKAPNDKQHSGPELRHQAQLSFWTWTQKKDVIICNITDYLTSLHVNNVGFTNF